MKRVVAFLAGLYVASVAYALPIDNPALPTLLYGGVLFDHTDCREECFSSMWGSRWALRTGYYGDYVYDRCLETEKPGNQKHNQIRQTEITTNAGYLALNWCDRVDLFATLGVSRMNLTAYQTAWFSDSTIFDNVTYLPSDTGFCWSGGVRATLLNWRCFSLGIEGQYFYTNPEMQNFHVESQPADHVDFSLKYREWQVGLGAAYTVQVLSCNSWLVPYIGVDWAAVRLTTGKAEDRLSVADTFFDMKNRRSFGYAVGLTFIGSACWSVTAEARFINQTAFYLNAQLAL